MLQKFKRYFAVVLLAGFTANSTFAESFNKQDIAFAFADSSLNHSIGDMALLSNQEMMETEGEVWPIVYGAAWLLARGAISTAGRYGKKYGYQVVKSTNNHRILLKNHKHILQTGGNRRVNGFSQKASHIGWGTSPKGNFSNKHIFYNSPWRIR